MPPLRKLRESGHSTPAQVSALLADGVIDEACPEVTGPADSHVATIRR